MTPEDSVLAACAADLADSKVVTDTDPLSTDQRDRSTGSSAGERFAVVFPRTTEQVSAVLAAAYEHRVPVVARGAGFGTVKSIEDFQFAHQPGAKRDTIARLAIDLGVKAAQQSHRVLVASATDWVTRVANAHHAGRLAG